MAEGEFDEFDLQDLGQRYSRYDQMNNEKLDMNITIYHRNVYIYCIVITLD